MAGYANAVADLVGSDAPPDLMLAPMINFGARLAREKWGIPLVTVHLYPMLFVTADDVPVELPWVELNSQCWAMAARKASVLP